MNARVALLLVFVVGCGAEPPPPTVVLATPALPPPIEDTLVAVSARPLPKSFVPDAAIGEWGSLDPPPVPPPTPDPKKKPAPTPPPPPKPASRVVVGLGTDRFAVAAELRKDARAGVWLSINFDAAELGPLGSFQRGGGVSNDECTYGLQDKGQAAIQACIDDLLTRSKAYNLTFAARFEHTYRLDPSGIRLRQGDALVPIAGAKVVSKEVGDAVVIEAELPLLALPRVATSPIGSMRLAARPARGDATFGEHERVDATIEPPVALIGEADLRGRLYEELRGRAIETSVYHYQPGEPARVSVTGYGDSGNSWSFDGHRYEEVEHPLFATQRTFGDVVVGHVFPGGIGTKKGEQVVAIASARGKPLGLVERAGKLHAFFYIQSVSTDDWREGALWTVIAVSPDGTLAEAPMDPQTDTSAYHHVIDSAHAPDFSTFGFRAERGFDAEHPDFRFALTWKWDDTKKRYVLSTVTTKVAKKKDGPTAKSKPR